MLYEYKLYLYTSTVYHTCLYEFRVPIINTFLTFHVHTILFSNKTIKCTRNDEENQTNEIRSCKCVYVSKCTY